MTMTVFCLLFVCLFLCCLLLFLRFVCLLALPCALLKSEWLFQLFYKWIFLCTYVQVDCVVRFISYLSFVILLRFVCSILMPCTFVLLHYDVNIMLVCAEGRLARIGWKIRPWPQTVILLININHSINLSCYHAETEAAEQTLCHVLSQCSDS